MLERREAITESLTLLLSSVLISVAAFTARMAFVPDVVPIAAVEQSQPLWALETAFLLKALEIIASFGAAVVLIAVSLHTARGLIRRLASQARDCD